MLYIYIIIIKEINFAESKKSKCLLEEGRKNKELLKCVLNKKINILNYRIY